MNGRATGTSTGRSAQTAAKSLIARPMPPTPMNGRATGTSTGRSARTAAKSLTARPTPPTPTSGRATGTSTGRSARSAAKSLTARPTPPTPTSGKAMAERNTGRSARSAAKSLTARPTPPTPTSGRATGTSTGRSARSAAKSLTARPILTTKIRASAPFAGILARSSRMKISPNSRTALLPKRNPSSKNEKNARAQLSLCPRVFFCNRSRTDPAYRYRCAPASLSKSSRTTSEATNSPAAEGTKEILPIARSPSLNPPRAGTRGAEGE